MSYIKQAFSMVELLVTGAIVAVLAGLLLPAVQKVRESSNRLRCATNLKQIATAITAYHDSHKHFPHDYDVPNRPQGIPPRFDLTAYPTAPPAIGYPECGSVFVAILPFIEHANLFDASSPVGLNGPAQAISLYLCPSRRSTGAGSRTDYGEGQDGTFFGLAVGSDHYPVPVAGNGELPSVQWDYPDDLGVSSQMFAVMGNHQKTMFAWSYSGSIVWPATAVTTIREVQQKDGTSNTLLIAHKGVEPRHYSGTGPNDEGYAHVGNYWEHKRYPGGFWKDKNGLSVGEHMYTSISPLVAGRMPNSHQLMTSPHVSMPCLFTDGSVRSLAYDISMDTAFYLWQYNDGRDRTRE